MGRNPLAAAAGIEASTLRSITCATNLARTAADEAIARCFLDNAKDAVTFLSRTHGVGNSPDGNVIPDFTAVSPGPPQRWTQRLCRGHSFDGRRLARDISEP